MKTGLNPAVSGKPLLLFYLTFILSITISCISMGPLITVKIITGYASSQKLCFKSGIKRMPKRYTNHYIFRSELSLLATAA